MISGFNHLSITDSNVVDIRIENEGRIAIVATSIKPEYISSFVENRKPLLADVDLSIGKYTLIFNLIQDTELEYTYAAYASNIYGTVIIVIAIFENIVHLIISSVKITA